MKRLTESITDIINQFPFCRLKDEDEKRKKGKKIFYNNFKEKLCDWKEKKVLMMDFLSKDRERAISWKKKNTQKLIKVDFAESYQPNWIFADDILTTLLLNGLDLLFDAWKSSHFVSTKLSIKERVMIQSHLGSCFLMVFLTFPRLHRKRYQTIIIIIKESRKPDSKHKFAAFDEGGKWQAVIKRSFFFWWSIKSHLTFNINHQLKLNGKCTKYIVKWGFVN